MSESAPFFIVGCPRSGTTLLKTLVDTHPDIAIPPESFLFNRFSKIFESYGDLRNDSHLRTFVKDLLGDIRIKDWKLEMSVDAFVDELPERSIACVLSHLYGCFARREGARQWGDKTPQHMWYLDEINRVFPEAKFIHLVRDGRDAAESYCRMYFGPSSIYQAARLWQKYILAFKQFKDKTDGKRILEVRYEDLVRAPKEKLKVVLDFLGRDFPEEEMNKHFAEKRARFATRNRAHASLGRDISDEKIGVFKKKFTAREIEIFESEAAETLRSCGYAIVSAADRPPGLRERAQFLFEDNVIRYVRKFKRPQNIKADLEWALQYQLRKMARTIASGVTR